MLANPGSLNLAKLAGSTGRPSEGGVSHPRLICPYRPRPASSKDEAEAACRATGLRAVRRPCPTDADLRHNLRHARNGSARAASANRTIG